MQGIKKFLAVALAAAFCFAFTGCAKNETEKLKIYMPDGAPALALAKMMAEESDTYEFEVVPANDIGNKLKTDAADIAIAPSNAVVNLYNKGKDYRIAALATVGNLYLIGTGEFGLSDLKGKLVGLFGQNNVPDLVFRALLEQADIDYSITDTVTEDAVSLKYYADGPAVMQAVKNGQAAFGLLPEPVATVALSKIENAAYLDIQKERENYTQVYGFPQAVLTVKGSVYETRKAEVVAFLKSYLASAGWTEANPEAAVAAVAAHMADGTEASIKTLSAATAARCNIDVSVLNETIVTDIKTFIQNVIDLGAGESVGGKDRKSVV